MSYRSHRVWELPEFPLGPLRANFFVFMFSQSLIHTLLITAVRTHFTYQRLFAYFFPPCVKSMIPRRRGGSPQRGGW